MKAASSLHRRNLRTQLHFYCKAYQLNYNPSWKRNFYWNALQTGEFETAGSSFSCGLKTLWKRRFSKTMASRNRVISLPEFSSNTNPERPTLFLNSSNVIWTGNLWLMIILSYDVSDHVPDLIVPRTTTISRSRVSSHLLWQVLFTRRGWREVAKALSFPSSFASYNVSHKRELGTSRHKHKHTNVSSRSHSMMFRIKLIKRWPWQVYWDKHNTAIWIIFTIDNITFQL